MLEDIDKVALQGELRRQLEQELEHLLRAQRSTQDGATHEESRPENDKDTRALESTYLARGLSERVAALENGLVAVRGLQARSFGEDDPVALGALVCVEFEGQPEPACYLLAAAGAGIKLVAHGLTIHTLTPKSPVGKALIGRYLDDEVEYKTPQGTRRGTLIALC